MIPKMPPREGQLGYLYFPPYRVQGISVAGEQTVVQIPELDLNFDMGHATRASLTAKTVALSHAHMDHLGALPYWLSQRYFQKLGAGRVVCRILVIASTVTPSGVSLGPTRIVRLISSADYASARRSRPRTRACPASQNTLALTL